MTELNESTQLAKDVSTDISVNAILDPPTLRFMDQTPTPIPRNESKRLCSELSPITEVGNSDLAQQIHRAVEESISSVFPRAIQQLESSLQEVIQKSILTAIASIKDEVHKAMMTELDKFQANSELKLWCETERLETYNRRDNLRLFNLAEEKRTVNGKQVGEDSDVTLQKVLMVAKKIDANVTAQDISIAHRLPARNDRSHRPIIVRFCRRVAKVDILKRKNLYKTNLMLKI